MNEQRPITGWREWLSLPELDIPGLKVKLDTGARTSALHAFVVEPFESQGVLYVRFGVHPLRKRRDIQIYAQAQVSDRRWVTDSGGHREMRYVIETTVQLGEFQFPAGMGTLLKY